MDRSLAPSPATAQQKGPSRNRPAGTVHTTSSPAEPRPPGDARPAEHSSQNQHRMIDAIITFSIRNRALVIGVSLVLAALGVWAAWETPVDAIPDLSENQVIVFTNWKGHGPREIEDQLTFPLTLGLRGLRGVRVVRSSSDVGFSMISVIFDDGVDSAEARRRVGERLTQLQGELPAGATPELDARHTGDRTDLLVHRRGRWIGPGPAPRDSGLVRPTPARLGSRRGGCLQRRRVPHRVPGYA